MKVETLVGKTVVLACLVVVAAITAFFDESLVMPAFLVPMSVTMYWCLAAKGKRKYPLAGIVVIALSACLTLGYAVYPLIEGDALVSMRIPYTRIAYDAAFGVIFFAISCVFIGGLIFLRPPQQADPDNASSDLENLVRSHAGIILGLALIPLTLYIVGYSPGGLIYRRHYLEMAGPQLAVSASSIFGPVGAVLVSIVLIARQTGVHLRAMAAFLLCGYFVVMTATGSRAVAVLPLILIWLYFEFRRPTKLSAFISVGSSLLVFVGLLNSSLVFRLNAVGAGLKPYLELIVESPGQFFEVRIGQLIGNILFGVPLTGDIVMHGKLDPGYFWTSVNPLPGGFTNWGAILGDLSWGPATPFNAFGELFAYGFGYLAFFMLAVGALISLLDNVILTFSGALRQTLTLVAVISLLLFASAVFQYPVRNASRIVWYLAAVVMGLALLQSHSASLRARVRPALQSSPRISLPRE